MGKLKDLFHFTLLKKNIWRYLPLILIETVLLFFMGTYKLIRLHIEATISDMDMGMRFKEELLAGTMGGYVCILFLMACAVGMCIFSYKFRKKSANTIHSLPVQRKTLYFTSVLSGLVIMFVPLLLNAGAMTAILAGYDMVPYIKYVGISLLLMIIISMIGFSIACLCCHLSSSMATVPFLFVFINCFSVLIESIIRNLMAVFLYGAGYVIYAGNLITEYLSPVYKLIRGGLTADYHWDKENWVVEVEIHWFVFLIYLAASIVLFAAGYLLYKKYRTEQVGDILIFKPVRYAIQYIACFMFAYYTASTEYSLLKRQTVQGRLFYYCLFMLIAGSILFFVFEMIAEKKWNVFAGAWRRFIPYAVVIAAIPCLFEADVFGYEKVLPDMDEIEFVYLEGNYGYDEISHNKNLIEKTRKLHAAILENKDQLENNSLNRDVYYGSYGSSASLCEDIEITYELKNGKKIQRHYTVYDRNNSLGMNDTYYDLITDPEYIITLRFGEDIEIRPIGKLEVATTDTARIYYGQKAERILDALLKDIRENDAMKDYVRYHNTEIVESLDLYLYVLIGGEEKNIYGISPKAENLIETLRELGYNVDKMLGIDEADNFEEDMDYYP